jgi:hypothetical protein
MSDHCLGGQEQPEDAVTNNPLPSGLQAVETHLALELGDASVARDFAEIIISDALQWRPPTVGPMEVETIVAYAFGNRIDANANRSPGPVNAALADVVVRLHGVRRAPIYAQWEIAEAIGDRVPNECLVSITPLRNRLAETVYLSTGGVAAAVVERVGHAARLGKVGVVGFADHIKRCIDVSRRAGMDAAAPGGYAMPANYDALSGQPWTRSRLTYLVHDLLCRAEDRRNALITGA